jgi:hypothetical protein
VLVAPMLASVWEASENGICETMELVLPLLCDEKT